MTTTPASSGEMDHLDQLGAKAFDGFLVRPYPVPTYVVEFLLGRYCASTDPNRAQSMRASGTGMGQHGIKGSDLMVIDRSVEACSGHVVVVVSRAASRPQ